MLGLALRRKREVKGTSPPGGSLVIEKSFGLTIGQRNRGLGARFSVFWCSWVVVVRGALSPAADLSLNRLVGFVRQRQDSDFQDFGTHLEKMRVVG